jgi:uncharacterized protein (TIGR02588 family)
MSAKGGKEAAVQGTSLLEWVVASAGALILIAMIAYLVFYGLTKPDGPPMIRFEAGPVDATGTGYVVQFTVRNEGHSTASALEISGRLMQGDSIAEESRATIDHVPEQSLRRGGLFFSRDPAPYQLVLRAEGYASP